MMVSSLKVAVISDTHDNLDKIERAMQMIIAAGVTHVIHAGDFVAPFSLKLILRDLKGIEFIGVYGNNDGEKEGLAKVAAGRLYQAPHEFTLAGKRFFLTHDIERHDLTVVTASHDVIIFGHSHTASIEKKHEALLINPGACCGILAEYPSIAFLTLPDRQATIVRL